jgi:hypothetical protein
MFSAITYADEICIMPLVQARVKSVEPDANGRSGTALLEILHVYSGDPKLKGVTFTDEYNRGPDARGRAALHTYKVDEEGLWSIHEAGNAKGVYKPVTDRRLPFRIRSLDVPNSRHAEHLKLAEVIESVHVAAEGKQGKMLVVLANDQLPEIATWAVRTLGGSDDPAAGKFLDGFVEKPDATLSPPVQIAWDEVLCEKRSEWPIKETRVKWLTGWVKGKADKDHALRLLSRLHMSHQREELRTAQAVGLVCAAADNTEWPVYARREAIRYAGFFGEESPEDDTAFDCLIGQIKRGKDVEIRRVAAESIRYSVRMLPARLKAVEDHMASEKDTEVLASLTRAVRKAKEELDEPKAKPPEKK